MSCEKKPYRCKKDAVTAANYRTRGRIGMRHNRPTFLRAYDCPDCGYWHLTHKPG